MTSAAQKQIVVLTGLSGAGKTTAARALEDLGFVVVDNLPPQLIEPLISFADTAAGEGRQRLAFVVDAREAGFSVEKMLAANYKVKAAQIGAAISPGLAV